MDNKRNKRKTYQEEIISCIYLPLPCTALQPYRTCSSLAPFTLSLYEKYFNYRLHSPVEGENEREREY